MSEYSIGQRNNRLEKYIAGCDPHSIDPSKDAVIVKARQMGAEKVKEDVYIAEALKEVLMDMYLYEMISTNEHTKIDRLLSSKDEQNKVLAIGIIKSKCKGELTLEYEQETQRYKGLIVDYPTGRKSYSRPAESD